MRAGLYRVHKPVGVTSFSLVQAARADAGPRLRLCHGGTLDPFAEGLLLLLAGPATRLMDLLHALPKRYVAQVAWGVETDTGDAGGKITLRGDASGLSEAALEASLEPQLGWQEQTPPATSAKKVDGEPAYRKAHRGEEVFLPPSRVYLHSARWAAHALPGTSTLELVCRGGYYVRALARDLGRALGCGAHLTQLRRLEIGPWTDPGPGPDLQGVHGERLVPWCRRAVLDEATWQSLRERRSVPLTGLLPPRWSPPAGFPEPPVLVAALYRQQLLALLSPSGAGWKVEHWLAPGL